MTFTNPIIPGFYPDPSVCRAGDDFYLVCSSFEYFPGVPIFHSRDLAHWRQIGHCLTGPSQLPLTGPITSRGIYAPTIRYHDGRFYMITTNVCLKENFIVSADNPAGAWSEPVALDVKGIDPSLFFDHDGVCYFTGQGDGVASQCTIDVDTGRRTSDLRRVWAGTGGRYPEAPHLYKIDGRYYLMMAEGGTEYGHFEVIARSDSPWGPFEPCPDNPILTHRDRGGHPIQAVGHADLVQAPDGSWWAVFLAIRPVPGYPPCHHLGRETFLAPVTWTSDGWPMIGNAGTVEIEMDCPTLPAHPWPVPAVREEFGNDSLPLNWNFRGNPEPGIWETGSGGLVLRGTPQNLDSESGVAWVGRRQTDFDCHVAALLDFAPTVEGDEAGLSVLMNEKHHYEVFIGDSHGRRIVGVRRRIGDLCAVVAESEAEADAVELHVRAEQTKYHFGFSIPGGEVRWLAEGATRYLATEVAGGFTGILFGLYVTGNGKPGSAPAIIRWFDYRPGAGP